MNDLTRSITGEYKPIMAVTVYKVEEAHAYYLESHDINEQGQLSPGKPLLQETLQGIVDVFFDERKNTSTITGLMPENLLNFQLLPGGYYNLIWWRPAEIRVIHHARQLKLPTAKAWVPAMVYSVDRGDLNVFALQQDKRPVENTVLCPAPFFNVNDDGDVCLGNAQIKKPAVKTFANIIKYWEDMFWLSEFSHVNGEDKVKSGDLNKTWSRLLASKTKLTWEAINELIPSERTLKDIL